MFELAAQFEYLMLDPEARARDYRDYACITQHRWQQDFYKNRSGQIISYLAHSPDRPASEAKVTAKFNQVKARFLRKNNRDVWDSWYCMTVRDLAKKLDEAAGASKWENEYRLWYTLCSDWAHGGPFGIRDGPECPLQEGWEVFFHCMRYYFRMLHKVSERMILTDEQYHVLELHSREFA